VRSIVAEHGHQITNAHGLALPRGVSLGWVKNPVDEKVIDAGFLIVRQPRQFGKPAGTQRFVNQLAEGQPFLVVEWMAAAPKSVEPGVGIGTLFGQGRGREVGKWG